MDVATPPVKGSGQEGVESQGAWPALPGRRSCFQLCCSA